MMNSSVVIKKNTTNVSSAIKVLNSSVVVNPQMQPNDSEQNIVAKIRRNSRNLNKNSVVINNTGKNDFLFSHVGGPEIAAVANQSIDGI